MNKRTPSMYAYYEKEIENAYQTDDWERVSYLINDCPEDVLQSLKYNGVVESSVEESRRGNV